VSGGGAQALGRLIDIETVRATEFPWTARADVTYLNHAGTGPLPQRTADVLAEWGRKRMEPWTVPDHDVVFPALAKTRGLCARLLGADASEIALVPNTSFGLSLAARALPLDRGDVVIASDKEFPSVIYAWRAVEKARGISLVLVPTRDGLPDEDAMIAALDNPRVKAVTVSWVSFATGYRVDLARLGAECRKRGVYLVVDAMQGLGPARWEKCEADIVACGGYKWLMSPWGAAFVYVRQSLIQRLEPPIVGWFLGPGSEDYTRLLEYDLKFYDDARRFEVMTIAAQDFVGMGCSLELLFEVGLERIEERVRELTDRIADYARGRDDMRLVTTGRRAGIVSVAPPDPVEASRRLKAAGVIHSLREGAIRLSPYFSNTEDEVDKALRILGG
jgi:cysteine desulfurase/selenocysteine lyase